MYRFLNLLSTGKSYLKTCCWCNNICQSLSLHLYTPAFPHYYLLQDSKHRNVKKEPIDVWKRSLMHSTSPPSFIDHVVQHICHVLYSHTPVTHISINNNPISKTTPIIIYSLPWNISHSHKSAFLTLPNMKSSDAISTHGNRRTHMQHFPWFISCIWAQSIRFIHANAGN